MDGGTLGVAVSIWIMVERRGGGVGWGVCGWMVGKCVNSDGLNSRLGCLDLSSYSYVQLSLWFPGF